METQRAAARLTEILESGHWLGDYAGALIESYEASGGMSFEQAEKLLNAAKEQYDRDLEVARRMYRLYREQVIADEESAPAGAPLIAVAAGAAD
jgi:hypothetical protein